MAPAARREEIVMPWAFYPSGARHFYYEGRKKTVCGRARVVDLTRDREGARKCQACERAVAFGPVVEDGVRDPSGGITVMPRSLPSIGVGVNRIGLGFLVTSRLAVLGAGNDQDFGKAYDQILKPAQKEAMNLFGWKFFDDGPASEINRKAARQLRAELAHLLANGVQLD